MRKILLNNKTKSTLFVRHLDNHYEINSGCNITLELNESNILRVYNKKASRICIGQFFSRETIRNIWIFGPIILINLDSIYEVPNGVKTINITERKCKSTLFTIFGLLLFNEKSPDSYDYHRRTDQTKLRFFSSLLLFPFAIFCFLLFVGCLYGALEDFSLETVCISLFCLAFIALFIGLSKTISNSIKINKAPIKTVKKLKSIYILKDIGWLIKYYEL